MLRKRVGVGLALFVGVWGVVALGGPVYLLVVLVAFFLAAREYIGLFRQGGARPAARLLVGGVWLFLFFSYPTFAQWQAHNFLAAALAVSALTWHLLDFERGTQTAGTDFCVTLAGLFYLGGLGQYFVALRWLPAGMWWTFVMTAIITLVDVGAYTFGRLWGRHKLAPRLSPNKTWEGYVGGIFSGALGGGAAALLFRALGAPVESGLTWQVGILLGLALGAGSPLGDLGVSMFKRQMGVKDTGQLFPGHGGMLDRLDSWLVAAPVAYYFVLLVQLPLF